jgi:hypothetical protein
MGFEIFLTIETIALYKTLIQLRSPEVKQAHPFHLDQLRALNTANIFQYISSSSPSF